MRNSPLRTMFRATQNSNSLRPAHLTHPACQSLERGAVRLTLTVSGKAVAIALRETPMTRVSYKRHLYERLAIAELEIVPPRVLL